MTPSDSLPEAAPPAADDNARPYSVSELAFALKRTLEQTYGFVRLRGELSKVTRHSNGHIYLDLKDEQACIAGVVWKSAVRGLKAQPEQGMEVVVTGRITTFPARSNYQIIIETMEPAGVGALLAQLERLKARLKDEGLFDAAHKRGLPPSPTVIGVITSPTGAVIRDILHRVRDRWPAHLLVWPVVVQGPEAAAQVANAVRGFNALSAAGAIPRPDLLIVARGGGSVEDLWPFNDEALARAVFQGTIPLISAVGHETDTTLIDFVSDRRAPTPTAAAEMATPVLAELRALVFDYARRMTRCAEAGLEHRRQRLTALSRGLPRPDALLGPSRQRFDLAAGRLSAALERNTAVHGQALARATGRLSPSLLQRPIAQRGDRLGDLGRRLDLAGRRATELARSRARLPELETRLDQAMRRRLAAEADRLARLDQLRRSLDPDRPLGLGFARVHRADGALVRSGKSLSAGEAVTLHFGPEDERQAVIDGARPAAARAKPAPASQGDLF